ncbi:deoxyhypusine synthase [Candidatus Woesearchaeota archaeon]|nr:deoxyhypusine synthase [Candidatus Woesearchaeota archaeon]
MGVPKDKLEKAKQAIWKRSTEPQAETFIKGMDFSKPFDIDSFIKASGSTGFQATHLAKSVAIIKHMRADRKDGLRLFLGYTSNMVSSGVREAILHLVKHNMVDVLVTTAGGIEEDFIKCMKPFVLGDFRAKGAALREQGINRTGNIFVPNDRYCAFEDFLTPILNDVLAEQKKTGHLITPSELIWLMGERIDNPESIYYWAAKHKIPVFCHAITDGSIGDIMYFFRVNHPELRLEIAQDASKLNDLAINAPSTGIIVLGAGLVKHMICNANMFREGAKYAVYVNTAVEYDGSDSGAEPEEAVSWGKIAADADHVKVFGDATILFPLIVAAAFQGQ